MIAESGVLPLVFSQTVMGANVRVKPAMLEKLEEIIEHIHKAKPGALSKLVVSRLSLLVRAVPLLLRVLLLLPALLTHALVCALSQVPVCFALAGEVKTEVRTANRRLLLTLYRLLGESLFDPAVTAKLSASNVQKLKELLISP